MSTKHILQDVFLCVLVTSPMLNVIGCAHHGNKILFILAVFTARYESLDSWRMRVTIDVH